jgi:hypothetical protein
MKKIVLSIAGVLAATAFAPEASAIPAFARQTSQACSACHFQHFPVLNPVGQEFKAGGFTQMSAKGKIKGENISIPDNLNAAILFKGRYQKTNGTDAAGTVSGTTTNGGQWQIPDELSLFFGGRVGEGEMVKMGFMFEGNTAAKQLVAGLRIPVVFDTGTTKLLAIPYATDSLGAGYGYELSSTGAVRGVRWAEHRTDVSAAQYVGLGATAATGVALVAQAPFGYINFSRYSPNFTMAGDKGVQMSSNWIRVAATPTVGDWAMHIGLASLSGSNYNAPAVTTSKVDTKGTIVDFQAQGVLGGNDTSLYAQYATAPAGSATMANYYNGSTANAKTATTVGIDYSVIPHTLHVGGAIRKAKNGAATLNADDSMTLTVVYDLFQNVALHMNHSIRSGSSYNVGGANDSAALNSSGKTLTTFLLEAAW